MSNTKERKHALSNADARRAAADTGPVPSVRAPERLVMEARSPFREEAIASVHSASQAGSRTLAIDLSATTDLDAAGLGVLVVVQRRATEKGLSLKLLGVSDRIAALLRLTKLDHLFAVVELAR